jgi:hypothetical protein
MNKITKETLKRIKEGDYSALIGAIEFLIDTYNEDKFDAGYTSALQDLSVRSYRLAEHIAKRIDKPYKPGDVKVDELAKVIESYYNKALKQ